MKFRSVCQSLKNGSVRHIIQALSGSGNDYVEVIVCLQKCYNKACLVHQVEVRAIAKVTGPKEGNSKELCRLHDICRQHLRVLKTMGYDPSGPFVTMLIKRKLYWSTLFEWQKHIQESSYLPHYADMLEFIDLRVGASEAVL